MTEPIECTVCYMDAEPGEYDGLVCGHMFCDDCWSGSLNVKINSNELNKITCMHRGCEELVTVDFIRTHVNSEAWDKYSRFISKSFVDTNSDLRWCPAPGCEFVVGDPIQYGVSKICECKCGYRFCYDCMGEPHSPVSCEQLKQWNELCSEDKETLDFLVNNDVDQKTLKWLQNNTKDCPTCGNAVQKRGGCFCMTCSKCSQQWCWLCLKPWRPSHSDHFSCAYYGKGKSQLTDKPLHKDKEAYKKRKRMQQFATYYRQFAEHAKEEDLTEELEQDANNINMLLNEIPTFDVTFLYKARKTQREAKTLIKYAYAKLFFIESKTSMHVYNLRLENLLLAVETLNDVLSAKVSNWTQWEHTAIKDSTCIVRQAIDNLLAFDDVYTH